MLNPRFRFAVIVLAAGQSLRFGGVNKLLAKLQGKPLIQHCMEAVTSITPTQIVVVTGHQSKEITSLLDIESIQLVNNSHYAEGMGTSIAAGIKALDEDMDAAFICLADMPLIKPDDFFQLSQGFEPDEQHDICVPVFDGQNGHPVLFGRRYFSKLSVLKEDKGARLILAEYSDQINHISFPSKRIRTDIDRPDDITSDPITGHT
jgi:molybdenum cofactor cytidylyltransferase